MKTIPENVSKAWDSRKDAIILSTVDKNGMPNAIYATCVSKYNESTFIIADNYFDKTRKNILAGSEASLLFITNEEKSYQLKGTIKYYQSGKYFENMKNGILPDSRVMQLQSWKLKRFFPGQKIIMKQS